MRQGKQTLREDVQLIGRFEMTMLALSIHDSKVKCPHTAVNDIRNTRVRVF